MSANDEIAINFKFPMTSVSNVEVNGVQYGPGKVFDAGSEDTRDFLRSRQAAVDYKLKSAASAAPDAVAKTAVAEKSSKSK